MMHIALRKPLVGTMSFSDGSRERCVGTMSFSDGSRG
jgi:hypothetical protein